VHDESAGEPPESVAVDTPSQRVADLCVCGLVRPQVEAPKVWRVVAVDIARIALRRAAVPA